MFVLIIILSVSEFSGWSSVNTIGHIVDVEQVDLLQDVVSVVQGTSTGCQTRELLYQPAVLPQQTPDLVLG